jgi:excisionase family DNA binding protein
MKTATLGHDRATATLGEVAALLGIGRSTAYELAQRDALPIPVIRLGRRMVVSRAALDRLLTADDIARPAVATHGGGADTEAA